MRFTEAQPYVSVVNVRIANLRDIHEDRVLAIIACREEQK